MDRSFKVVVLVMIACAMMTTFSFAQQGPGEQPAAANTAGDAEAAAEAAKAATSQPKDQTIYGEVQAVNAAGSSMTVQYYDYDTDGEKSIELSVAADTKIENAANLGAIKKGDWADITYLNQNAKNMAKSIIVEKEEEVPAEALPEGEMKE